MRLTAGHLQSITKSFFKIMKWATRQKKSYHLAATNRSNIYHLAATLDSFFLPVQKKNNRCRDGLAEHILWSKRNIEQWPVAFIIFSPQGLTNVFQIKLRGWTRQRRTRRCRTGRKYPVEPKARGCKYFPLWFAKALWYNRR